VSGTPRSAKKTPARSARKTPAKRLRVAISSDHEGDWLKERLAHALREERYVVKDCEVVGASAVDIIDLAVLIGRIVVSGEADLGVVIAASGPGASMAANKLPGVRSVHCQDPVSAAQSRRQLDANVLCLGARILGEELAVAVAQAWVAAEFTGQDRHVRVCDKMDRLDSRAEIPGNGGG